MAIRGKIVLVPLLGVAGLALMGAAGPRALTPAMSGLWAIGQASDGHDAQRLCISDMRALAQWEHRSRHCRQTIIADGQSGAIVEYVCANGDFGRSDIKILTPRTLRIQTQGISKSFPFAYTLHARRLGACAPAR